MLLLKKIESSLFTSAVPNPLGHGPLPGHNPFRMHAEVHLCEWQVQMNCTHSRACLLLTQEPSPLPSHLPSWKNWGLLLYIVSHMYFQRRMSMYDFCILRLHSEYETEYECQCKWLTHIRGTETKTLKPLI